MAIIDEELLEKRYRQLMAVTIRKSTLYASTEIAFDKGFWREEEWYKHEICFPKLGIPARLILKCTWDNYNEIIDSVRRIQGMGLSGVKRGTKNRIFCEKV